MADIHAFIAARLDEDEAAARAAIVQRENGDQWRVGHATRREDYEFVSIHTPPPTVVEIAGTGFDATGGIHGEHFAAHIARHDPARVLAEIAAKRQHIVMWQEAHAEGRTRLTRINAAPVDDDKLLRRLNIDYYEALGMLAVAEKVLRLDANVYAEHPDYDPEWRIDA